MDIVIYLFWILASIGGILYSIFVISLFFGLKKIEKNAIQLIGSNKLPFVSVIVPVRNEEENILALLQCFKLQNYPGNLFEIIFADDQSTDRTGELVIAFQTAHPQLNINLLKVEEKSSSPKKNAIRNAVSIAAGDLIVTTDADCSMGPGWLSSIAACFEYGKYDLIIGPVAFSPLPSVFAKMQALEFLSLIASGAGMAALQKPMIANGANLAFIREAYIQSQEVGKLSQMASGDDLQLLFSVKKAKGNQAVHFLYNKQAIVYTQAQPSLRKFFNQRIRWASKAKGYTDFWAIAVSWLVFIFCLIMVSAVFLSILHWTFALIASALYLLKTIADLPLLLKITKFAGQLKVMKYYLLLQLLYPFYIVIAAIGGLGGKFRWKDRNYQN